MSYNSVEDLRLSIGINVRMYIVFINTFQTFVCLSIHIKKMFLDYLHQLNNIVVSEKKASLLMSHY